MLVLVGNNPRNVQDPRLEVAEDTFYTSAMATADFLRVQQKRATAYIVGERGTAQDG